MSPLPPEPTRMSAWAWILDAGLAVVAVQVAGMVSSVLGAVTALPSWLVLAGAWTGAGAAWALARAREPGPALDGVRCLVGGVAGVGLSLGAELRLGAVSVWVLADMAAGAILFTWAAHAIARLLHSDS